MKKVICKNRHFYDADRFEVCPICGQGSSEVLPRPSPAFESEETVPLPPSSGVDELAATAWIPPEEMRRMWGDDAPMEPAAVELPGRREPAQGDAPEPWEKEFCGGVDEPAGIIEAEPDPDWLAAPDKPAPEGIRTPAWETADEPERTGQPESDPLGESAPAQAGEPACAPAEPPGQMEKAPARTQSEESAAVFCETASAAEKPDQSGALSLAQAVAQTNSASIPAVPPEPLRKKAEAAPPSRAALPVGWLVGLSGENRGRLFPCRSGRNRIGRAPQMDITIPGEPSVDLDTHAQIIYEPKKRQFFLQVGNGEGLSYLNGELVFTHEELHAYDRITLGDAEFIFLPLCGEAFDWNMTIHRE